jgi:glycosyltransferase involved in cell wall biosynthesis
MPPRAICHLVTTTAGAGFFEFHARAAVDRGVRPLFVTVMPAPPPTWLDRVPGARYHSLGARSRKVYPLALVRLVQLLRRERIDVLHTHLFDAMVLGVVAGRLAQVPLIAITRHHLDDAILAGARNQDRIERALATLAHCIVAPSAAVQKHLIEYERHPPGRIEHIYHGWDFSRLDTTDEDRRRVRAELGIGPDDFLLGTVGRFSPNKGHEYLLEALAQLVPAIPGVRLLLLGEGDQQSTRGHIARLGLESRVVIAGWRADVAACMGAMDVLVHPSLSEAFCQVIIEGMGVGVPVVSTAVGGAPETITDGDDGLLIPPRDAGAIVRAVRWLHDIPDRRRQIAARGRQSVRQRFTADKMITAYYDLYDRRLPSHGSVVSPNPHQFQP